MIFINNKKERIRFIKFLVVGLISAAIDFGFMNLFTLVFSFPLLFAQALSFLIAVVESFFLNRIWIYPDSISKSFNKQFVQFLAVNLVGIAIRSSLISLFNNLILQLLMKMNIPNLIIQEHVISRNLALASVVLIVLFWNFFVNRFWTYSDVTINRLKKDKIDLNISVESSGNPDTSYSKSTHPSEDGDI